MALYAGNLRQSPLLSTLDKFSPVAVAFMGSILLSLVALRGGLLNRDGMLYVDAARNFQEQGLAAALGVFQWPFLPVLMAYTAQLTGLSFEYAGHLLNMLFMAGACALFVACARRIMPEAIWPICFVVLALPAFNGYRDELLREYGCWFFVLLSFWMALNWADRPTWRMAFVIQGTLCVAALFRPEAIAFLLALILWRIHRASGKARWTESLMLGVIPLLGMTCLVLLYFFGELPSERLAGEIGRFRLSGFDEKSAALATGLIDYAKDQASTILLLGSLALVPLKFITKMGVFLIPTVYAFIVAPAMVLARTSAFIWAFLVHAAILCVFALDMQFLAGRYMAPLVLFCGMPAGYGLALLLKRHPRLRVPIAILLLVIMLGNVVSTGSEKTQFFDAGVWLASQQGVSRERIYVDDARVAYYAGWSFSLAQKQQLDRGSLAKAIAENRYDQIVLTAKRKDPGSLAWIKENRLVVLRQFSNQTGDSIIIGIPEPAHGAASTAATSRENTASAE